MTKQEAAEGAVTYGVGFFAGIIAWLLKYKDTLDAIAQVAHDMILIISLVLVVGRFVYDAWRVGRWACRLIKGWFSAVLIACMLIASPAQAALSCRSYVDELKVLIGSGYFFREAGAAQFGTVELFTNKDGGFYLIGVDKDHMACELMQGPLWLALKERSL